MSIYKITYYDHEAEKDTTREFNAPCHDEAFGIAYGITDKHYFEAEVFTNDGWAPAFTLYDDVTGQ